MNQIQEALEQNNTTEGKLSALLGVADRLQAQNAELLAALGTLCTKFDRETYANVKAAVLDARALLAKYEVTK
jgi:hypothetical protein